MIRTHKRAYIEMRVYSLPNGGQEVRYQWVGPASAECLVPDFVLFDADVISLGRGRIRLGSLVLRKLPDDGRFWEHAGFFYVRADLGLLHWLRLGLPSSIRWRLLLLFSRLIICLHVFRLADCPPYRSPALGDVHLVRRILVFYARLCKRKSS